jgi:TolB protein
MCQAVAASPLDLVLTQGTSNAIPIAIVPFSGQSDSSASNNVSSVINADLQYSGQFKPMDPQTMTQMPHSSADVNANYWRQANMNDVVVGSVQALGGNSYKVSFALISLFNGQQNGNQVLASQDFTVPGDQLRALAHHISDIIYQQLTGMRGIFSTKVAYVLVQRSPGQSKYTLDVADIDGYNPKPLLVSNQPIMSPAWSHDGKQIAYVSFEDVTPKIYVQQVGSGARHVVSSFPGINGAPAWSPDNSQLAIVLSKGGNAKIYLMSLGSGQLKQLTFGNSIDTEPNWTPDGQSLLFTSDRGGGPQIYKLNLGSGDTQRLTFNGNYNARGTLTPDGQTLVMIHREHGQLYNIAAQDMQSGGLQILSQSGFDASPSVAPNGRMVLYESDAGQQGVLGMTSIDGRIHLQIPSQNGSVQDPAWSPFLS